MKTSVCSASPRRCPRVAVVTILADRGFGDVKLFAFLDELGFDGVIRFRGNIHVAAADGETRLARGLGRHRRSGAHLRNAARSPAGRPDQVGTVVVRPRAKAHERSPGAWPPATTAAQRAPETASPFLRQALEIIEPGVPDAKDLPLLARAWGRSASRRLRNAAIRLLAPQRLRDRPLDRRSAPPERPWDMTAISRPTPPSAAPTRSFDRAAMLYELIPTSARRPVAPPDRIASAKSLTRNRPSSTEAYRVVWKMRGEVERITI